MNGSSTGGQTGSTVVPARILIVDDMRENILSLSSLLPEPDYLCVHALSGREALEILVDDQNFALILLDVQMPGIDGFEVARLIQEYERTRDIPIIFITAAYTAVQDALRAYNLQAIDYIHKPIVPEILRAKVGVLAKLYCNNRQLIEENAVRQRLESTLRTSNQNLEQFAYIASHDLQEPLRMITGFLQLIERRYKDQLDEDANTYIRYAVDGAIRMKLLINDLLAYSRVGTKGVPFETTDMELALRNAMRNTKSTIEDVDADITHDPLPTTLADPVQMTQLFQNLISNALRYRGKERLQIYISSRRSEETADSFPDLLTPGWIFSVSDNGIGIERQFFDRIFVIFQQLHARSETSGSGIGLAISKRIVERHGGRIWVESAGLGKGSIFYFHLPDNPPDAREAMVLP